MDSSSEFLNTYNKLNELILSQPNLDIYGLKTAKLLDAKAQKEQLLARKDNTDYGNDSSIVRALKNVANKILPDEYALTVNVGGKRYDPRNKIFNENDLNYFADIYKQIPDDPTGSKVFYYLRKKDPYTGKYVYKPGIADVSAADRYITQLESDGWELIDEKRFHEAEEFEKLIHGNKYALEHRVFDYGTPQTQNADNFFGPGYTELYDTDILGLDTKTSKEYESNYLKSLDKAINFDPNKIEKEDTFEFIDALQAGAVNLAGKTLSAIGEAINRAEGDGALETLGKRLQQDANKIAGYNPKAIREASLRLKQTFRDGDALGFVKNIAKGSPQWLAYSIPDLLAFLGVTRLSGAAGIESAASQIMAGAATMGAINANKILDDREQLTGRKATPKEIASIYAISSALSAVEYGALKFAFVGNKIFAKNTLGKGKAEDITEILAGDPSRLAATAKWVGDRLTGGMVEGSEEVVSSLGEFLMTNYGTQKYEGKTIADMLKTETAKDIAIESFGAGLGAGGLASISGQIKDTPKAILEDIENRKNLNNFIEAIDRIHNEDVISMVKNQLDRETDIYANTRKANQNVVEEISKIETPKEFLKTIDSIIAKDSKYNDALVDLKSKIDDSFINSRKKFIIDNIDNIDNETFNDIKNKIFSVKNKTSDLQDIPSEIKVNESEISDIEIKESIKKEIEKLPKDTVNDIYKTIAPKIAHDPRLDSKENFIKNSFNGLKNNIIETSSKNFDTITNKLKETVRLKKATERKIKEGLNSTIDLGNNENKINNFFRFLNNPEVSNERKRTVLKQLNDTSFEKISNDKKYENYKTEPIKELIKEEQQNRKNRDTIVSPIVKRFLLEEVNNGLDSIEKQIKNPTQDINKIKSNIKDTLNKIKTIHNLKGAEDTKIFKLFNNKVDRLLLNDSKLKNIIDSDIELKKLYDETFKPPVIEKIKKEIHKIKDIAKESLGKIKESGKEVFNKVKKIIENPSELKNIFDELNLKDDIKIAEDKIKETIDTLETILKKHKC